MENNVVYLISNHLPAERILCECTSFHIVNAQVIYHTSLHNNLFYVYSSSIALLITNKK